MRLPLNQIICGDCLEVMKEWPDQSVNCCVTSPPYWGLRDYGVVGQLGLESTPEEFVSKMVEVFREVRRVLRDDGTLWLNLGDSYAGSGSVGSLNGKQGTNAGSHNKKATPLCGLKPKDLCGIPWRVALALQADGWYLRQDIIWSKPNPMPESVRDRCTKAHEYIFLLTKSPRYWYDAEAIKEESTSGRIDMESKGVRTGLAYLSQEKVASNSLKPQKVRSPAGWKTGKGSHGSFHDQGREQEITYNEVQATTRNKRSVWTVPTKPYSEAHFATFPPDLIEPCILAGCPKGGVVMDPFMGSGTVAEVAAKNQRDYVGCELNPEYMNLNGERTKAANTGVPVKEARAGQLALFGNSLDKPQE